MVLRDPRYSWLPPLPPTPDTTLRWSVHKCDSKNKGRQSKSWWRSWWAAIIRAWDGSVQNGRWGWGIHQSDFGAKFKMDMGQTSKWMWGPPNSLLLKPREPEDSLKDRGREDQRTRWPEENYPGYERSESQNNGILSFERLSFPSTLDRWKGRRTFASNLS